MLSLHEAMQLDFAAGGGIPNMDVGFGFGFDATAFGYEGIASDPGFSPVGVTNIAGDDDGSGGGPLYCDVGGGEGEEDEDRRRRLRRKISNRESARRSRARRRQRVEELERAVDDLRAQKRALAARLDATVRQALAVRGDNTRLHAEAGVLRRRLDEAQRNAAVFIGLSRLQRTHANNHGGTTPPQPAGGMASWMMT